MSDCPCKAEEIMAKAKKVETTETAVGIVEQLDGVLKQMATEAETSTGDDLKDAKRREAILKLDTIKKFIEARW